MSYPLSMEQSQDLASNAFDDETSRESTSEVELGAAGARAVDSDNTSSAVPDNEVPTASLLEQDLDYNHLEVLHGYSSDEKENNEVAPSEAPAAQKPPRTSATRSYAHLRNKRKTYTEEQYKLILNATTNKQRKVLADAIGMPWGTARNLVLRHQKTGKTNDERHFAQHAPTKKKLDPYDSKHIGKWGKLSQMAEAHLFHLVRWNCCQTLDALRVQINRELTREFLMENVQLPTSAGEATEQAATVEYMAMAEGKGSALGVRPLLPEEEKVGGPLNEKDFEGNSEFEKFKSSRLIKSNQTILNHLQKEGFTRKVAIIEKATANTPKAMKRRLQFACFLKLLADGTLRNMERDACMFFMDEMPFYLNPNSTFGRAKKGQRAIYRGPPTSKMSFRTQLCMTVHPTLGVFAYKQYNPQLTDVKRDGTRKKKATWSSGFGKKDFEDFLHFTMAKILAGFADENLRSELEEKDIYIFLDGAPEHGKSGMEEMSSRFAAKKRFDEVLKENNSTFKLFKLPSNSPHLNLCEYYNREVRYRVNRERNKPEIHKIMQLTEEDLETERGHIVENRVNALHDCIEKAFDSMLDETKRNSVHYARGHYNNWISWVERVRKERGYLNYYEPM